MRHKNDALLAEFRGKTRCELCRCRTPGGCHPHHVHTRGAGRLDIRVNLVALCWSCHGLVHNRAGHVTRALLIDLVAERERTTAEAIEQTIWDLRRLPKGSQLPAGLDALQPPPGAGTGPDGGIPF